MTSLKYLEEGALQDKLNEKTSVFQDSLDMEGAFKNVQIIGILRGLSKEF